MVVLSRLSKILTHTRVSRVWFEAMNEVECCYPAIQYSFVVVATLSISFTSVFVVIRLCGHSATQPFPSCFIHELRQLRFCLAEKLLNKCAQMGTVDRLLHAFTSHPIRCLGPGCPRSVMHMPSYAYPISMKAVGVIHGLSIETF